MHILPLAILVIGIGMLSGAITISYLFPRSKP